MLLNRREPVRPQPPTTRSLLQADGSRPGHIPHMWPPCPGRGDAALGRGGALQVSQGTAHAPYPLRVMKSQKVHHTYLNSMN